MSVTISKKNVMGYLCRFRNKSVDVDELVLNHLDTVHYQISGKEDVDDEYVMINSCVQVVEKNGEWFVAVNGLEHPLLNWLYLLHIDGDFRFDALSIW